MKLIRLRFLIAAAAWCIAIALGFFTLERYEATPGEQGTVRSQWPEDSGVARVPGCYNLVLALHPRCPCSRASVSELEKILAQSPQDVRVHVLVFRPSDGGTEWEDTGLVSSVKKLPGVLLHADDGAAIAERFGARTSGEVVLYGPSGELLFRGGLTAARGHMGDAPSQDTVRDLLHSKSSDLSSAPVYGCPLQKSISGEEPR
jgi:hypothetical protein